MRDDHRKRALRAQNEGRFDDARRELHEAAELLRSDGDQLELAAVLRNLGELERRASDGDAARQCYEESVAILRELNHPLRLAHTVRHLGDVHHEAGCRELAETCYLEALVLYRNHERTPPLELANAIRCLAVVKDEAEEDGAASRLWKEALDLYAAVGISAGVAESSARLALLAQREGDLLQSREWLAQADAAAGTSGDRDTVQYVREVTAQVSGGSRP